MESDGNSPADGRHPGRRTAWVIGRHIDVSRPSEVYWLVARCAATHRPARTGSATDSVPAEHPMSVPIDWRHLGGHSQSRFWLWVETILAFLLAALWARPIG